MEKPPIPVQDRTKLSAKVRRVWEERLGGGTRKQDPLGPQDFVVSVEVNPAPGLSTDKPMAVARMLRAAGVDVVNIADGPRATVRMSNTALAQAIQAELEGCETIVHVCCRDRNLLGLMSDLLGNYTRRLHNLVVITGDPVCLCLCLCLSVSLSVRPSVVPSVFVSILSVRPSVRLSVCLSVQQKGLPNLPCTYSPKL